MMTVEQFVRMLNTNYGMKEWPKELIVDAETYGNCCQVIINKQIENEPFVEWFGFSGKIKISVGSHNGIMFKNIELILKS